MVLLLQRCGLDFFGGFGGLFFGVFSFFIFYSFIEVESIYTAVVISAV